MIEKCNLTQRERWDHITCYLILILAAIQNRFFDDLISIAGMDAVSLFLSLVLMVVFGWMCMNKRIIWYKKHFLVFTYFVVYIALNFLLKGLTSTSFLLFRTSMYFISTFLIFSNLQIDFKCMLSAYRCAAVFNSVVCLYFYLVNVNEHGAGFRDVSINLYFSLLGLMFFMFIQKSGEIKIIKYLTYALVFLAIVTSQQRSQIIPLAVILIMYIFTNMGFNIRKLASLIAMVFIVAWGISYAQKLGMWEYVVNRFANGAITAKESTLIVRMETTSSYLGDMNILQWLFGVGFNANGELEMLVPNYLYKYGIWGSFYIVYCAYLPAISNGVKEKTGCRFVLITLIICSIGGMISGFGGQNGQLLLASLLGLMNNKVLLNSSEKGILYHMPLVKNTGGGYSLNGYSWPVLFSTHFSLKEVCGT